ncbi:MAG: ABC transporter ATP-binding protein, partial [Candidatus Poribacteria bacterium]|nr:ABC transporter ATP-binding protein [Candidatus Poribacteria bacterium]
RRWGDRGDAGGAGRSDGRVQRRTVMAVLEGVGLARYFGEGDARVTAVDHVDVSFDKGELVMVMGDSGCGKTTLVSMLGCLLTPSEGKVILDGSEVDFFQPKQLPRLRREKIGFVFQMFNLIPYLTARENVMLALDVAGVRGEVAEKRAAELLGQVGLSHRLEHRPAQLSGGEKQRVSFARALANRPSIIFADEPTANLDSKQSQNLLDLVRELRTHHDTTIVMVTHHTSLQKDADRVIHMRDGAIVPAE